MSGLKTVKIGDICEQINGVSYKPSDVYDSLTENSTVLLRANNIFEDELNFDELVFVDKKRVSENQYMKKGDILICASSGSKHLVGKAACLSEDKELTFGAFCKVLRPKTVNSDFLKHYFFSPAYRTEISRLSEGVNINNIKAADLGNLAILLPTESEQNKIAKQLDKCIKIINNQKRTLEKYDTLIKSRFIEMFGDPVNNPMNWEIKPMGELLSLLTDFSSNGSYKTLDSNVIMYDEPNYALMIRTTDLESGDFINNVKWVDEKAYNLLSKSKVFGKEIIMNKIGSAGKVYLMPELNRPVTLGRNAFLFRYKENINSVYIYFLLTSEYGQNEIKPYIRGAVTKTITKDDARKIRIPVPSITLQNNFENFVHQIDKSKFAMQKSLEKTEILYKSLMKEYFG